MDDKNEKKDSKKVITSINLVLIVSMGVTARIASIVPAPIPAKNC